MIWSDSRSATKSLPPAGTRPPAPPWAKIAAWLVLLACLCLAAARGTLLDWAARQPQVALAPQLTPLVPKTGAAPSPAGPQGLDRLRGMGAAVVRLALLPPGFIAIQSIGALGLAVIGLELAAGAVALAGYDWTQRRGGALTLRVRLPQAAGRDTGDAAGELLRTLHQQLPSAASPLTPWLALTLGARPDEPAELGIVIAGGVARQRAQLASVVRTAILGHAPDAVVEICPDPLAAVSVPGSHIAWAEWRLALPPSFPLRANADHASGTLLGPLAAAVAPRSGVAFVETQLVLQPRRDDAHLARGWRAEALRRLLRLKARGEHALTPDTPALEAKLAGPAFNATLRAVAVAETPADARAALGQLDSAIGQYAARSGSRLQRWRRAGSGSATVREIHPLARGWRGPLLTALLALTLGGVSWPLVTPLTGAIAEHAGLVPLLALPPRIAAWLPLSLAALLPPLLALGVVAGVRAALHLTTHAALARPLRRAPRPAPLPGLLWGTAWPGPAILGPDELAGLWHLPTPALGRLVRWLPCRQFPPPPYAFVPPAPSSDGAPTRLILGYGRHRDGTEGPIGLPLRDARQGIAFTAPPGVGKTQLAANLADQLRPCGYTLIDGKGDDAGNLGETMCQRIPLDDEARLVIIDLRDSGWPAGFNPLAGVDLSDPGGVDQVLGQIEAIFARLDPDTWSKAPRMKNYLRKATLLVLAGESNPTIAHVKQALLDERYRQTLLPQCTNVEVRDFWTVEFPQIGEQQKASRDALVSRFDALLDSELTRYLFNQITPALSFDEAIAERRIVLIPLPHRALGGLAAPVGVLLFQAVMRAAFRRPGSDLTRPEYGFIGDEFQVLVENCDTKDVRDALTQVRSFGIITIIANQLHAQLGDLAEYALTAIANRVILRTQEPDATLYARHYAESGVTASDISGQEPREHQYAWFGVDGRLTRLCSMRPLPWVTPLTLDVPPYDGLDWRAVLPEQSPTPAFDVQVLRLMYGDLSDEEGIAQALAQASGEQWDWLMRRWDAIRRCHRAHILAHPGCIPETRERQRWLSRLAACRRRVLAKAEYARVRQAIQPGAAISPTRAAPLQPASVAAAVPGSRDAGGKATQIAHYNEIDQEPLQRLQRADPNDVQLPREGDREGGSEEGER